MDSRLNTSGMTFKSLPLCSAKRLGVLGVLGGSDLMFLVTKEINKQVFTTEDTEASLTEKRRVLK